MPKCIDSSANLLNKFKYIIQHEDKEIATGRRLSVGKWVQSNINQIENLEDDKLQYLFNIFRNENCWFGTKLNITALGKMLTEEKIDGIENPLTRYNMACKYCVIDRIQPLFRKQFESSSMDDESGNNNFKYIRNKLHSIIYKDPLLTFWINKKSGKFNSHDNVLEGFKKAIEYGWYEGVQYFYDRLNKDDKAIKEQVEYFVIDAINFLSTLSANYESALLFDFFLHILMDPSKENLLLKLPDRGKGILYQPLRTLIIFGFVDTVYEIVKFLSQKKFSVLEGRKILSHHSYAIILSSLSNLMLENPDVDIQAKARLDTMELWKCKCFFEHRNIAVHPFRDICTFASTKRLIAMLIIDWKRDEKLSQTKKNEILEILQFAKDHCSEKHFTCLKKNIIKYLRISKRVAMRDNFDYGELAEKIFSHFNDTDNRNISENSRLIS